MESDDSLGRASSVRTHLRELVPGESRSAVDVVTGETDDLWPEERAAVARAIEVRVREFATGRRLARSLLAELGVSPTAIGVGPLRQPQWPEGIQGSIAHDRGLCAVVLTRGGPLGIDLEAAEPLGADVYSQVLTDEERALGPQGSLASTALFCAKECYQKARTAQVGRWLEFWEVRARDMVAEDRVRAADSGLETAAWRLRLEGPPGTTPMVVRVRRSGDVLVAAGW
jgi:4'-phosphopantetheinyl transferase EntD